MPLLQAVVRRVPNASKQIHRSFLARLYIVSPAYPTFSQFFSQGNKPGKTQLLNFWDFWVIPNHPEVHLLRHLL
jgi:hypothetical protein